MLFYQMLYDRCSRLTVDSIVFSDSGAPVEDLSKRPSQSGLQKKRLRLKTLDKWKPLEQVLVKRVRCIAGQNAQQGQNDARSQLCNLLYTPAGSDVAELLGISVGTVPWSHRGRSQVFSQKERDLLCTWFMVNASQGDEWHDEDGQGRGMRMHGETTVWPPDRPQTGGIPDREPEPQYWNICGRLVPGSELYDPFGPFMMHVLVSVFGKWPHQTFGAFVLDGTLLATPESAEINARLRLRETHHTLRVPEEKMSAKFDYNMQAWCAQFGDGTDQKDIDAMDPPWPKVCPELMAVADLTVSAFACALPDQTKWNVVGTDVHAEWHKRMLFWDYHWDAFKERFVEYWVWQSKRAADGTPARKKSKAGGASNQVETTSRGTTSKTPDNRAPASGSQEKRGHVTETLEHKMERLRETPWARMDAEEQAFWRGECGGDLPTRRQGDPYSACCSFGHFCDSAAGYAPALAAASAERWPYECKVCAGGDKTAPAVLDKACLERYLRVMLGGWAEEAVLVVWGAIEDADGRMCKVCTDAAIAAAKSSPPKGVHPVHTALHMPRVFSIFQHVISVFVIFQYVISVSTCYNYVCNISTCYKLLNML